MLLIQTAPVANVTISSPSTNIASAGPVTYLVTYTMPNFSSSTLAPGNITLNKTGTANASVAVSGTGNTHYKSP